MTRFHRIDAHHHLWDLSAVHYPWLMAKGEKRFFGEPQPIQRDFLLDEFRAMAMAEGFSGSVHIQVGAESGLAEAQWVDEQAKANPDWPLVQVAFADLTAPDLNQTLDQLQQLGSVRGIRQIVGRAPEEDAQTGTNALINNPAFAEGLAELARRGLSFDLQLIPEFMADMADLLAKTPDLKVSLCHAGSPYERSAEGIAKWQDQLKPLAELPQVYCKISGLGMFDHDWTPDRFSPIVATCLDAFGSGRCMVGSNFPVDSLYSDYNRLMSAFKSLIPEDQHDDVFGGTAQKFYRMNG